MKLGFIYTVFDNTELLEGSIKQILPYVDEVLIIAQSISNTGEMMSTFDTANVKALFGKEKISVINYEPNGADNIKEKERKKHNIGIQHLKAKGFTHFAMGACDHYYLPEEFLRAKIKALKYDVTLTDMYTYFKKPEWRLDQIENYQMPFICKIYPNTEISKLEYNGFRTDPSLRINTRGSLYMFPHHDIMLHHYSMIRNNIERKFESAAIFKRTPEAMKRYLYEYNNYDINSNPGVEYFGGRKVKVVPNQFDIQV